MMNKLTHRHSRSRLFHKSIHLIFIFYSTKGENIMDTKVNTYRTTAKVVGALYILGFVVGIAGSVLGAPGQLDTVSTKSMMIAIGALLWVIAAAGDAAHGVLMYPILKQNS